MKQPYQVSTQALSIAMLVLGVLIVIRTLVAGGGVLSIGILLGVLFCAVGAGRLYIERVKARP